MDDYLWVLLVRLECAETDYSYAHWLYWQHNGTESDAILAAQLKGESA